ncbi:MAG: hypothetical protein RLZZ568_499 [Cyanobacteriota bacterium]|jgi:hypothetical protein
MTADFVLIYLLTISVILVAIGAGYYLGTFNLKREKYSKPPSLGSVIGAMLGLLGFVLALTFSMVSSRYDVRKALVLEEANAIGTAYLRTDFLGDPFNSQSKILLKQYVDNKASYNDKSSYSDQKIVSRVLLEGEKIQDQLWTVALSAPAEFKNTEGYALYIESLNQVIDIHTLRITQGLQYRLPKTVWLLLYVITMLSMFAVGYEFGINESGSVLGSVLLAMMFAAVVMIIGDLDRSYRSSLVKVSQQPILELQKKLQNSMP